MAAIDNFLVRKARFDAILDALTAASDDMFDLSANRIDHTHVAALTAATATLRAVATILDIAPDGRS